MRMLRLVTEMDEITGLFSWGSSILSANGHYLSFVSVVRKSLAQFYTAKRIKIEMGFSEHISALLGMEALFWFVYPIFYGEKVCLAWFVRLAYRKGSKSCKSSQQLSPWTIKFRSLGAISKFSFLSPFWKHQETVLCALLIKVMRKIVLIISYRN